MNKEEILDTAFRLLQKHVEVCIDCNNQRIEGEMAQQDYLKMASLWAQKRERCNIRIKQSGVQTFMTLDLTGVTSMLATPKVESNEPS